MDQPPALPKKLKDDAIVEAICELRFDPTTLPETAVGRLLETNASSQGSAQPVRLAAADIPAPIRQAAGDLRYQPWYELRGDGGQLLRLGPNVLSYHRTNKYPGWSKFKPEIFGVIGRLFEALPNLKVTRIGLRYVNALVEARHFIKNLHDLSISISVGGDLHRGQALVHLIKENDAAHVTASRIASPVFVTGVSSDAVAIVDVDVYTPEDIVPTARAHILEWVDAAHEYEKAAFFSLIPRAILDKLKEE